VKDEFFEWDDTKAASNWRDHGVTFEMARDAFKDTFSIDWIDDRQDATEERLNTLAVVGDRLLHVSYTLREERIRILSARKAEPHERRRYHNENREA
jgi:uncharacterized DUF497 family protein